MRIHPERVGDGLFYAIVFVVFVMPLLRLAAMAFTPSEGQVSILANFAAVAADERTAPAVANTLLVAVGSCAIATLLGTVLAFIVAYLDVPAKRAIELLTLMPFIVPSYIVSMGWGALLGPTGELNRVLSGAGLPQLNVYSLGGIVFVLGICSVPVVYLNVISTLRKVPRDQEWAARAAGCSIARTMVVVNLAECAPAIVAGAVLSFLSAIDNFAVPAFLGISSNVPVLSTLIYQEAIGFGPGSFNIAAALSVVLALLALVTIAVQRLILRRAAQLEGGTEDREPRIACSFWTRPVIAAVVLAILVALNVVPVLTMVLSAFRKVDGVAIGPDNLTTDNFAFVLSNSGVRQAAANSLFLAVAACVICIAVGMFTAYGAQRRGARGMRLVEAAASLTYSLPGIVLALAMIFRWSGVPGVYGTMNILLISYVMRYLLLEVKGSATALNAVDASVEEAARVAGAGPVRRWMRIMAPLLAGPVLSNAFLIFVLSSTELTLSSLLAGAGTRTIGLAIFSFQQAGDYDLAAAFSTCIVVVVLAGYALLQVAGHIRKGAVGPARLGVNGTDGKTGDGNASNR